MDRLQKIRRAEEKSHTQAYNAYALFTPGSWLANPVKTVLELIPLLEGRSGLRALDLGCGVGRNCIPIAKALDAQVECVDILPLAIEKLEENAEIHGVSRNIRGIVSGIDAFPIQRNHYDLILAISALEHMDSAGSFTGKLREIRDSLLPGGIVCMIVNSGVEERDAETGESLHPQFEVNLPTAQMRQLLRTAFSGMGVIKETVVHQEYDISRGNSLSHLTSQVVTFVAQK